MRVLCVWLVCALWMCGCGDYVSVGDAGFDIYDVIPQGARFPVSPALSSIDPLAVSAGKYDTTHFLGPERCANCHNEIKDEKGQDVPIETEWSSTMMANAARDPYWHAKVESEMQKAPHLRGHLADKCTVCHAPMAHFAARKAGTPIKLFGDDGFLNPKHKNFALAMDGVSCTLCHQLKDTGKLGTLEATSGNWTIGEPDATGQRKLFGPYFDVETEPMRTGVGYTPTGSKHISESGLCASCHDLKTAYLDAAGKVVPKTKAQEFPEQMTYSEWKFSRYSNPQGPQHCQFCHMTIARGVRISFGPPWIKTREFFRRHTLAGANLFMLDLMKEHRTLLGIRANNFAFTRKRTEEMLASAAKLEVVQKSYSKGRLLFQVKVRNKAGHKLPSGYPSRRAFLHVVVRDGAGEVRFESGKMLAHGHIVGVDADRDGTKVEPHYERITRPDQVQVYESIMQNTDGAVTYSLLRAATYKKDNRLLPEGFDKDKAAADIKVHGAAAKDENFIGGSDLVTYDLRGFKASTLQVTVTFKYQSIAYQSALSLFSTSQGPYTKRFLAMYDKAPQFAFPLASVSFSF